MEKYNIKQLSKQVFTDIKFWILLYFIIQLFSVTHPPLEGAENWRQTTGIMIYKNFYEVDANIFYPRLDNAGENSGILGTEFCTLQYLSYIIARLLGFQDWYGRLINMIISSLGIFFFYRIVLLFFNKKHAFLSAFLLLNSIWFMYNRKSMPDTYSVALAMISIYYGIRYLHENNNRYLITYFFIGLIGILSKLPAILPFMIFLLIFFNKGIRLRTRFYFALASSIILLITVVWYFYWVPYLNSKYGFDHYFMGVSTTEGIKEIISNWKETLKVIYFSSYVGYIGFMIFLAGLFYSIKDKQRKISYPLLVLSLGMIVFIIKSGWNFCSHPYYMIPFLPIMSVVGAYFLSEIKLKWAFYVLLIAFTGESIANQQHELFIRDKETYKLEFKNITDKFSTRQDLFATNGGINPQQLYFMNRKGWTFPTSDYNKPKLIPKIINLGCHYLFINKRKGNIELDFPIIYNDSIVKVYDLREATKIITCN
ncbi:MAG: ArnT family glycosyltransferase [Hyphomicrobiales bacterium]